MCACQHSIPRYDDSCTKWSQYNRNQEIKKNNFTAIINAEKCDGTGTRRKNIVNTHFELVNQSGFLPRDSIYVKHFYRRDPLKTNMNRTNR